MNVLKNMEAIFIVAVAVAWSASALAQPAVHAPAHAAAAQGKMVQVVIKAKRLSAAEKLALR